MEKSASDLEQTQRYQDGLKDALKAIGQRRVCLRAKDDLLLFFKTYLPEHFTKKFGSAQLELISTLERLRNTGARIVRAEPREYGKTTILAGFILWCTLYQKKKFILLISDSTDQASLILQSVAAELEENPAILRDFGDLKSRDKWGKKEILTTTGIRIAAKGAGTRMRGVKSFQYRPDLILLDDLENDNHIETIELRDKLHNWLKKAVLNLVPEHGDVVMVGTILHHDSVLSRVLVDEVWDAKKLKAIEDGESTWPEGWSLQRLAKKKLEIGSEAFAQEYLNDPSETGNQAFNPAFFNWYVTADLVDTKPNGEEVERPMRHFLTLDPAYSGSKRAHYAAMVVVGVDIANNWYIKEIWREHASDGVIVAEFMRLQKKWDCIRTGVETVFMQKSFKIAIQDAMLKKNQVFDIADLKAQTAHKDMRIRALVPRWELGTIHLAKHDPNSRHLEEELRRYPKSKYDDILDALAYHVELAYPPTQDEFDQPEDEEFIGSVTDDTGAMQGFDLSPAYLRRAIYGEVPQWPN